MSEWREMPLGEVLDIKHGYAFKGAAFSQGGACRLVTPGNFHERGGFRDRGSTQKSYDGPIPEEYVLAPGSLVVAMTEQAPGLLGSSGLVPRDDNTWLHNQRIGLVRIRDGAANLRFLYYLFNDLSVRAQISASATGTKVRHTAPRRIEALEVPIPDIATQSRIAAVLSAFDEGIEINERRIELLEHLAQSLYREWFVRFRFPGHEGGELVDSELGPIPEGWEVRRLGDLAEVLAEGVSPSDLRPDQAYVGLEHLPRRQTTLREWGAAESVTSRKLRFLRGDSLFGKIRPYFHKVVWAPFDGIVSSDAIVFRPAANAGALVNAVMSSDQLVAEAVATSNGTKMPRADPNALLAYRVAVPSTKNGVVAAFERTARAWLELAAELVCHNRHLAATRDLLLPRLVTGRLDISDVDLGDLLPAEAA